VVSCCRVCLLGHLLVLLRRVARPGVSLVLLLVLQKLLQLLMFSLPPQLLHGRFWGAPALMASAAICCCSACWGALVAVCSPLLILLLLPPADLLVTATRGVSVASTARLVLSTAAPAMPATPAPAADDCRRGENRIVQELPLLP
jgi:hypothetical protein